MCSAVVVMGKSRPAAMGTDWADLADTGPKNKVNSVLHVLGRFICASSEERLTVGFTATVRGRLEKGQLVSKISALGRDREGGRETQEGGDMGI